MLAALTWTGEGIGARWGLETGGGADGALSERAHAAFCGPDCSSFSGKFNDRAAEKNPPHI